MPMLVDPDLLRAFVAVAANASFARAAELTHRSPAAVSMQIKRLEDSVGARLFDRDTRSTRLTAEGETFLGYAQRILDLQSEALDAVKSHSLTGRVVFGAPDDYASALLPSVLRRFSRLYPKIEIELICQQTQGLMPLIAADALDVALISRSKGAGGVFVRHEPMVWVGRAGQPVWQEQPLPVALYEKGSVARKLVLAALSKAGIRHRVACESASLPGLICAVEAGLAVAALSASAVPASLQTLSASDGLPAITPLEILLLRSDRTSPQADALAAVALDELRRS